MSIDLTPEQKAGLQAELNGDGPAEKKAKLKPGQVIELHDPKPWPAPVDGAALADEMRAAVTRHVALSDEAADAVTLWVLFTHNHEQARVSPILAVTSPIRRCGKTTTLDVIERLAPRPLPSSNITAAAVFRVVEATQPTLLIDEADSFLGDREDLRGILNSGHSRSMAFVIRTVGEGANAEVRKFCTWAPKVLAAIGKLPDTLADRSIAIHLERRKPSEKVEALSAEDDRYADLARKAARWTADVDLPKADLPAGLHDRAADNWRMLVAIAEALGGDWPRRARHAALMLSEADPDESAAPVLLADLHEMFVAEHAEALPSASIVAALIEMEDRPWPEWGKQGKPLSTRQLAKLLRPFDVRPGNVRVGDRVAKGYHRDDFTDAWARYLSQAPPLNPLHRYIRITKRKTGRIHPLHRRSV